MRKQFFPKRNIVITVSEAIGVRQSDGETAVRAVFGEIGRALAMGMSCEIHNFGTFELVRRKSRPGRNPRDVSKTCVIPERNSVKFRPAPALLAAVAGAGPS